MSYEDTDAFSGAGGEEVFTLTAVGFGNCDFTIAYARVWEFTTFRNHKSSNGYTISIPIVVLANDEFESRENYEAWETDITNSDQTGWLFGEGEAGDLVRDRNHYVWWGAWAWVRSFTLLGSFGFLPSAIAQARLNRYHLGAAPKFMWAVKWWSHVAGLCTTFLNLTFAAFMISGAFSKNGGKSCGGSRRTNQQYSLWDDCDYWSDTTFDVIGGWVIMVELLGTWAYYFTRKGAYRYAAYIYEVECPSHDC